MTPEFWRQRWQANELGWHEGSVNTMLAKHWPAMKLRAGSKVFVPLCGKSRDMAWLAGQGHRVIGVELSEIAVRTFFSESGIAPEITSRDGFEVSSAGGIEIWRGDLFQLRAAHLADVAAAYDRASLVAMPPEMQPTYAAKMAEVLPPGASTLLITFTLDEAKPSGPPFSTPIAQVHRLFGNTFDISVAESRETDEVSQNLRQRGVTRMEQQAILLRRR